MTLALEIVTDHAIQSSGPKHPGLVAPSVFGLTGFYQALVASGPRKPVPRFTATIAINPATEPSALNVCRQREFVARVIRAAAEFSPAMIVVDKSFVQQCALTEPETVALLAAVRDVSVSVPIIVGRRLEPRAKVEGAAAKPPRRLQAALRFDPSDQLKEAITNLDQDTRRLPLGWTASDGGSPEWRQTIALEAARVYDPALLEKFPLLQDLISLREHPYISFLRLEDLDKYATYTTREVLCASRTVQVKAPHRCEGGTEGIPSRLRGRIVVIGERDDRDAHLSVMGAVPGFVLHANYIEALLDARYFREASSVVNYAFGFLIYLAFHWVLITHHHAIRRSSGWRAAFVLLKALAWAGVVIVATFGVLYLAIMHGGWYVNPVTLGVLAIVIKFSELIFAKIPDEA